MASIGRSWARVGLLGNPSDGYGGAVIACTLRDFAAEVHAEEASAWDFGPASAGSDGTELATRLPAATDAESLMLAAALELDRILPLADHRAQRLRMTTTIPRQAGLSGSSAIVIASMRALCSAYGAAVPEPVRLAELALRSETEQLGIAAGPQDRLIQSHEGCLLMDFASEATEIERLPIELVPAGIVAWHEGPGESSNVVHSDLRARFDRGEPRVVDAMRRFRAIVLEGRDALVAGAQQRFAQLVDENFDLRASIQAIAQRDRELVDCARGLGAAAKFCGSGGSILALPRDGDDEALARAMRERGYRASTMYPAAPASSS